MNRRSCNRSLVRTDRSPRNFSLDDAIAFFELLGRVMLSVTSTDVIIVLLTGLEPDHVMLGTRFLRRLLALLECVCSLVLEHDRGLIGVVHTTYLWPGLRLRVIFLSIT